MIISLSKAPNIILTSNRGIALVGNGFFSDTGTSMTTDLSTTALDWGEQCLGFPKKYYPTSNT